MSKAKGIDQPGSKQPSPYLRRSGYCYIGKHSEAKESKTEFLEGTMSRLHLYFGRFQIHEEFESEFFPGKNWTNL